MANKRTTLGTKLSPLWDEAWIARIEHAEKEARHAICGARTNAGEPCKQKSTAPNGRCAFHGGHAGAGAPKGNDNARAHGLYSRRLQPCGPQCAAWDSCPFANDEVAKLPRGQRPTCPYEQEEYDRLVDTGTAINAEDSQSSQSPQDHHPTRDRHDLALLQVMVSRAAVAASHKGLTREHTHKSGATSATLSPELNAFLKLNAECRRARAQQEKERAAAEARQQQKAEPVEVQWTPAPNTLDAIERIPGEHDIDYLKRLFATTGSLREAIQPRYRFHPPPPGWQWQAEIDGIPEDFKKIIARAEDLTNRRRQRREQETQPEKSPP